MKEEVLEDIGLSKNEARVYLALVQEGSITAGKVAEKAGMHRTNAYDTLSRLVEKGLVSFSTKDKIKYFEVGSPDQLLRIAQEKEKKIADILPELKLAHQTAESKSEANVSVGVNAFMEMLYQFLEYNEPILVFGIPQNAPDALKTKIPHFHEKRIPLKIGMKHIYNHDAKERISYLNTLEYTEARALPEKFDAHVSTNICGPEVVFSLWTTPPRIIRVKDESIAKAYKQYFELLWNEAS